MYVFKFQAFYTSLSIQIFGDFFIHNEYGHVVYLRPRTIIVALAHKSLKQKLMSETALHSLTHTSLQIPPIQKF